MDNNTQTIKQMTDAEYILAEGAQCPFCRSTNIDGDEFDCSGKHVHQSLSCCDCQAEWQASYTIQGFWVCYDPNKKEHV